MNVSMNGLRRNIARSFNVMIREDFSVERVEQLREMIAALLCVYDNDQNFSDMSEIADMLMHHPDYSEEE